MSDTNGVVQTRAYPDVPPGDTLAHLAGLPPDLLQTIILRVNEGFAETQRRDGNAVWHSWQWMRAFFVVLLLWVGTAGVGLWVYAHSRDVEVLIQTVVWDKERQVAEAGLPQKLLEYTPEEGQWFEMVEAWVEKFRWRTDEVERRFTQQQWRWLYSHTCGAAGTKLAKAEKEEQPFVKTSVVRDVKIRSTTKIDVPYSVVVIWDEAMVDKVKAVKEVATYTGTFVVGRVQPKTADDAHQNKLGLCVKGYSIRKDN